MVVEKFSESWESCLTYFFPRKWSLKGRKFGFVKFSGIHDAHSVVMALNGA
ncbi:hypothetical protein REPUB_Repub08aG0158300 [Reevesia pubescens]